MRKLIIGIPLLSFALIVTLIIIVNLDDSKSTVANGSAEDAEAMEMSGYNLANPKGHDQQNEYSEFESFEQWITAMHDDWYAVHPEQRYSYHLNGSNIKVLSKIVTETNYWQAEIKEKRLSQEFDRLQSTAFQISSPLSNLHDQNKENQLFEFENQLNIAYDLATNPN